jgi:hypothetical protein
MYVENGSDRFESSTASARLPAIRRSTNDALAFSHFHCEWRRKAETRLIKLCGLPVGWDGHGGLPTDRDTAEFAASILAALMLPRVPMPSIMPMSYGGVQLEWHRNGWDIEIEIISPNRMHVYTRDIANDIEEEFSLGADLTRLRSVIDVVKL